MRGRLCNWSKERYEEDTSRMRATHLKLFLRPQGPRAYYWEVINPPVTPPKEPEYFIYGRLFHELLIEGRQEWVESEVTRNLQNESYQMLLASAGWELSFEDTGEVYLSGKKKGQPKQIASVAKEGKPILKKHEGDMIRAWRDGCMRNKRIRQLVEGPRFGEQVVLWEEDMDGFEVPCKAAIDLWGQTAIGCFKTTFKTTPDEYRWECHRLNYPFSAAFQLRGRNSIPELKDIRCSYFHVVVCKSPPHYSYLWDLHPAWIRSQRFLIEKCLKAYVECRKREAEGMDPLEAWPDLVEREEGVLVQQPAMWAEQGRSVSDYDPSP